MITRHKDEVTSIEVETIRKRHEETSSLAELPRFPRLSNISCNDDELDSVRDFVPDTSLFKRFAKGYCQRLHVHSRVPRLIAEMKVREMED